MARGWVTEWAGAEAGVKVHTGRPIEGGAGPRQGLGVIDDTTGIGAVGVEVAAPIQDAVEMGRQYLALGDIVLAEECFAGGGDAVRSPAEV